ncbi:MAG TPA: class I SAM-dependent methyltransferase [Sphingomicrobium sp.]|nr:class I SAM-dependent methyltransferase [Sphingomicrobium sp.]
MLNTDKAWKKWGSEDPYFGVLAHERFAAGNIERNREEFFATGQDFIADILKRYELLFGELPRARALDHGCGVGRLTLPLTLHFANVVALDVSPDMLAEAKANSGRAGVANAHFLEADDHLSNAEGEFDFVNSNMVLQHVPVRRGLPLLFRLIEKVRPGGGFHIQLSYRIDPWPWRLLYWASANIPGVKVWQNICAGRQWNAPAMQMNNYPINAIVARLAAAGITQLFLLTEPEARYVSCSLIGRKAHRDIQKASSETR